MRAEIAGEMGRLRLKRREEMQFRKHQILELRSDLTETNFVISEGEHDNFVADSHV